MVAVPVPVEQLLVEAAVLLLHVQPENSFKKHCLPTSSMQSFCPGQLESTLPAMHHKDVFVRMATGSGKSLCMFLVPLSRNSTAMGIIISPLKALMEQQVTVS